MNEKPLVIWGPRNRRQLNHIKFNNRQKGIWAVGFYSTGSWKPQGQFSAGPNIGTVKIKGRLRVTVVPLASSAVGGVPVVIGTYGVKASGFKYKNDSIYLHLGSGVVKPTGR